MTTWYSHNHMT